METDYRRDAGLSIEFSVGHIQPGDQSTFFRDKYLSKRLIVVLPVAVSSNPLKPTQLGTFQRD